MASKSGAIALLILGFYCVLSMEILAAAENNVNLVEQVVYNSSATCADSSSKYNATVAFLGEANKCLAAVGINQTWVRFAAEENVTTIFNDSIGCSMNSFQTSLTTIGWSCISQGANLSSAIRTVNYTSNEVFRVTYSESATCNISSVTYMGNSAPVPVLTTGALNACIATGNFSASFTTILWNTTYLNTTQYVGPRCIGSPVSTWLFPLSRCIETPRSIRISSTPYMLVSLASDVTPFIYPKFFVGKVDLNADASSLNAQIVGSSVGVLCGITALLVTLSFMGYLD